MNLNRDVQKRAVEKLAALKKLAEDTSLSPIVDPSELALLPENPKSVLTGMGTAPLRPMTGDILHDSLMSPLGRKLTENISNEIGDIRPTETTARSDERQNRLDNANSASKSIKDLINGPIARETSPLVSSLAQNPGLSAALAGIAGTSAATGNSDKLTDIVRNAYNNPVVKKITGNQ